MCSRKCIWDRNALHSQISQVNAKPDTMEMVDMFLHHWLEGLRYALERDCTIEPEEKAIHSHNEPLNCLFMRDLQSVTTVGFSLNPQVLFPFRPASTWPLHYPRECPLRHAGLRWLPWDDCKSLLSFCCLPSNQNCSDDLPCFQWLKALLSLNLTFSNYCCITEVIQAE